MATHAYSTRTPLLRPSGSAQPLLGLGLGRVRQSVHKVDTFGSAGPVTQAIRAMRAAQPVKSETISHLPEDIRELRRRIADRIEADIALLDALDGDPDLEADYALLRKVDGSVQVVGCASDHEPSLCGLMVNWPAPGGDDREFDEAEGCDPIPDWSGRGAHEVFVGRRA